MGSPALPTVRRQVQVARLSADFRAATCIAELPLQLPPPAGTVVVRILWAGINASDVNFRCHCIRLRHLKYMLYARHTCSVSEVANGAFRAKHLYSCSSAVTRVLPMVVSQLGAVHGVEGSRGEAAAIWGGLRSSGHSGSTCKRCAKCVLNLDSV